MERKKAFYLILDNNKRTNNYPMIEPLQIFFGPIGLYEIWKLANIILIHVNALLFRAKNNCTQILAKFMSAFPSIVYTYFMCKPVQYIHQIIGKVHR